jgi:membrane-bound ClpP family serine protease
MWVEAFLITVLGGVLGGLIHRFGGRAAGRRIAQLEQERQQQASQQNQRQQRLDALVGRHGVAVTDLKACGSASFDGQIVEVRAFDGFIAKGTSVVVKMLQGKTPVVERRQPHDDIAAERAGHAD